MLSEKLRTLAESSFPFHERLTIGSTLRALADEAADLERDITRATLGDVPATIAASDAAEACHQCGSPMGSGYCLACQPPDQPHPQAVELATDIRAVATTLETFNGANHRELVGDLRRIAIDAEALAHTPNAEVERLANEIESGIVLLYEFDPYKAKHKINEIETLKALAARVRALNPQASGPEKGVQS